MTALAGRGVVVHHARWRARFLASLVARDLAARYKGSLFGWLWPILVQLMQLLVFTYLFAAIFRVRMPVSGIGSGPLAYGLWLFAALLPWNVLQNGSVVAATSVVAQSNLVKRVVFPLALLPLVPVASALVEALAGVVVLVLLAFAVSHRIHATVLALPIVVAVELVFVAGIAWFLSALTAFVRDVPQTLGPVFLFWFYVTPIVYPYDRIPLRFAGLVTLNPMTQIVEAYRAVILEGRLPFDRAFGLTALAAAVVAYLGWLFFRRARVAFADVV